MSTATIALLTGLAGKIFLGEAYPSGNAYLQPFRAEFGQEVSFAQRAPLENWPQALNLHCLNAQGCANKEVGSAPRSAKRTAYFTPTLKETTNKSQGIVNVVFDYIPGREGMDEEHNDKCGLKYKKDSGRRYGDGPDYFETVFDYCHFDEPIARYEMADRPANVAYQIIAASSELKLADVRHGDGKSKRPITPADSARETKAQKASKSSECTTKPGTIKDAVVLLTGKIEGSGKSGQSLRVSTYMDPGCAGHLSRIYVLDVMDGNKVTGTFFALRYFGPI